MKFTITSITEQGKKDMRELFFGFILLSILSFFIWNGWTIQVGEQDEFKFRIHQLPLKRFFNKNYEIQGRNI